MAALAGAAIPLVIMEIRTPGPHGRSLLGQFKHFAVLALATVLAACATTPAPTTQLTRARGETVQILAINDFHGHIEDPKIPTTYYDNGKKMQALLGGGPRLAATLAKLRQGQPYSITVAAGDLVGASPLASAYFLDEPSIEELNAMHLSLSSVGNHEFDKGIPELRRKQNGGCETYTKRKPCRLEKFRGADFQYLAANVLDKQGNTLFPATAIRQFGPVRIGFIGMTLKDTPGVTVAGATKGYHFADEADTANRLAAKLRREGVDAVVLLIHQGGLVDGRFEVDSCNGLKGDILPILARLTPAIHVVVSAHTHNAYVCRLPDGHNGERLLTSAGAYGYFVTDIRLTIDPATHEITAFKAVNDPVLASAGEQPAVAAIAKRYGDAIHAIASRVVGRITGSLARNGAPDDPLRRLVADSQLAAARAPDNGGAQIAFINTTGVRPGLTRGPDGAVTYDGLFKTLPFGNELDVLQLTGAQLKQTLEDEFPEDGAAKTNPSILIPSQGFTYSYDLSKPLGHRIVSMTLDGKPIDPDATYRIAVNDYVARGGDHFGELAKAKIVATAGIDIDALQKYVAKGVEASQVSRVTNVTPDPAKE